MGGNRISPIQYMQETIYYHNARSIVLKEQHRIQKIKDKEKEHK